MMLLLFDLAATINDWLSFWVRKKKNNNNAPSVKKLSLELSTVRSFYYAADVPYRGDPSIHTYELCWDLTRPYRTTLWTFLIYNHP